MQSKDLRLTELLSPETPEGFPAIGSQQMLILGRNPLIELLVGFGEQFGRERTRERVCKFGFKAGLASALNVGSLYAFDALADWLEAGVHLARMAGIARVTIEKMHIAPPHRLLVTGRWHDSIATETWMNRNAQLSDAPVCAVLCALLSGYASAVMGEEVICRETECRAMGHAACRFEARTAVEWGDRADALRPYEHARMADIDLADVPAQARRNLAARTRQVQRLPLPEDFGASRPGEAEGIIYDSREMHQVMALAGKVAPTRASVLVQGESGVGKELIARYVHRRSLDAEAPFLAVNCAALPPQLLESELFGHVRGAFTGADSDHKGLFVEAGNGTLFLDEIGEIPPDLQAKLLRALNEREVRPVGGLKHVRVAARIIAATNQNLRQRLVDGSFRQDLFFRLAVFPIDVPPPSGHSAAGAALSGTPPAGPSGPGPGDRTPALYLQLARQRARTEELDGIRPGAGRRRTDPARTPAAAGNRRRPFAAGNRLCRSAVPQDTRIALRALCARFMRGKPARGGADPRRQRGDPLAANQGRGLGPAAGRFGGGLIPTHGLK